MTEITDATEGVPISPATSLLNEYEPLLALYDCWKQVRTDKMIPAKYDFEGALLDCPELLPDVTLVETVSLNEFRYLYLGSNRVGRRSKDFTQKNILEMFAPAVRPFELNWMRALFERPFISLHKDRTLLRSGTVTENATLCVVLSDNHGAPACVAAMTVADQAFGKQMVQGGYLLGSAGVEIAPIDIGLGVPDLPRTAQ